ncbi:MAG: YkgB family protein [Microscillaceae bacterium]|nr:YkgB family protein [Microscillaceae bacterium]
MQKLLFSTGAYISLYGTVLVLLWIGAFKFTPTEAKAIVPLVSNSPLMSWLYLVGNPQQVSNFIGIFEIITALFFAAYPINYQLGRVGALLSTLIFLATLSFMFTTPNSFQKIDGFWVPDAFILKDLAFLGLSLMFLGIPSTQLESGKNGLIS